MNMDHPKNCECAFCRDEKPFEIPTHLIEKLSAGDLVVFAGAGISTENKTDAQSTFYEEIHSELKLDRNQTPSFPDLMSLFCNQPDGRIKLIERIKHRLDYFSSFDRFYNRMSRFHRALSPFFMITDVITTNWDDFLERECGFDAFVYDSDLAFWDASRRRVMKIHGSISNFGSIVATAEDYRNSFKRLNNGPLGAHLKSLIARKTILYVGYSLSDKNYLRLLRNIAKMMGDKARQSYFVSPNINKERLSAAPISLIPIETDGAYFLTELRRQRGNDLGIVNEHAFFDCALLLEELRSAHVKATDAFIKTEHPLLIFALSYQDGLSHALQRILRMRTTGEYHSVESVHNRVHAYENKINDYLKKDSFWHAAYGAGYQNGLLFLLLRSKDKAAASPPLYEFPFTPAPKSLSATLKWPKNRLPQDVAKFVKEMMKGFPKDAGVVPDHPPYF